MSGGLPQVLTAGSYLRDDLRAAMDEDDGVSWCTGTERRTRMLYPPSSKMRRIMSDSMTSPVLRSALASNAGSIAGCVRAAYSPYIKRIGTCQRL